jgi:hypothetical protein
MSLIQNLLNKGYQANNAATSSREGVFNSLSLPSERSGDEILKDIDNPLPIGAIDRLPNGEAYYGEGIGGWWNGVKARMGEQSYAKQKDGTYAPIKTSGLQMTSRAVKELAGGVMNAFTEGQEKFQELGAVNETLENIADQSKSWIPDINSGLAKRNWVYNFAGQTGVIGQAYNTARILTGSRKMSWDEIQRTYEGEKVLASKLGGSQTYEGEYLNKAFQG